MDGERGRKGVIVGFFILLGIIFLISGILLVGNLSGTFKKKVSVVALFDDVGGLKVGNDVWFSGVKIGVINDLKFYSQSKVKVLMKIQEEATPFIRKDAMVKLSSEGIIGNKILIIYGGTLRAPAIENEDTLKAEKTVSTEEMINILQDNNKNLLSITSNFKDLSNKLMNGEGTIGKLLTDEALYDQLNASARSLQKASGQAIELISSLTEFSNGLNKKGTLANELTTDTTVFKSIRSSITNLKNLVDSASVAINNLKDASGNPNTLVGVMLHDEESGAMLKEILRNLEAGSQKLDENLKALQSNFLFRRYFKNKEKENK